TFHESDTCSSRSPLFKRKKITQKVEQREYFKEFCYFLNNITIWQHCHESTCRLFQTGASNSVTLVRSTVRQVYVLNHIS
ncbi:hypothetical protein L9F63_026516, partial [Diploptera punctata]